MKLLGENPRNVPWKASNNVPMLYARLPGGHGSQLKSLGSVRLATKLFSAGLGTEVSARKLFQGDKQGVPDETDQLLLRLPETPGPL